MGTGYGADQNLACLYFVSTLNTNLIYGVGKRLHWNKAVLGQFLNRVRALWKIVE